jgi:hypothetical protein
MGSERQNLMEVLEFIEPALRWGAEVPRIEGDEQDVVTVATALLRVAVFQARAVLDLHGGPAREAVGANCRSLCEAFAEIHWLLRRGDRLRNSRKAFIFAHFELVRELMNHPEMAGDLSRTQAELARLMKIDPAAYAEVEAQINSKAPKYWPGVTRTEMVQAAFEWVMDHDREQGRKVASQGYRLMSWEGHHVMAVIAVIDLSRGATGRPTIQLAQSPEGPDEFYAGFAALLLAGSWQLLTEAFPAAFVF